MKIVPFFLFKDWMAFENYPSSWRCKESKSIMFSSKELPAAQKKYALCRVSLLSSKLLVNIVVT